ATPLIRLARNTCRREGRKPLMRILLRFPRFSRKRAARYGVKPRNDTTHLLNRCTLTAPGLLALIVSWRPHPVQRRCFMESVSRRDLLAAATVGTVVSAAATAGAQTFGNPDQPPQGAINARGNPASTTIPGPQNPALASQFPDALSPPPTDVGD